MGHDISGFNKAGEEIAYARFSMGNYNSITLYTLLDAGEFFAGVSGCGADSTFSIQQMETSMKEYHNLFNNGVVSDSQPADIPWDQKQIFNFIQNCLATAQKEGSVRVYFG